MGPGSSPCAARRSFNPLHCGAVVASVLSGYGNVPVTSFQSPSLRGSGRFPERARRLEHQLEVSIPFIAGQWSLPTTDHARGRARPRFNPLHCGAVVASRNEDGSVTPIASFNPLHCGAVVASEAKRRRKEPRRKKFQSPSLRGSGRFMGRAPTRSWSSWPCFNPLHCGAVVAS
jgi:hypothetical protein